MFLLGKAGREEGRGKDLGKGTRWGWGVGAGAAPPRLGPAGGKAAERRGPRAWRGSSAPSSVSSPDGSAGRGAAAEQQLRPLSAGPGRVPRRRRRRRPSASPGPRWDSGERGCPAAPFLQEEKVFPYPLPPKVCRPSFQARDVVDSFLLIFMRSLSQVYP